MAKPGNGPRPGAHKNGTAADPLGGTSLLPQATYDPVVHSFLEKARQSAVAAPQPHLPQQQPAESGLPRANGRHEPEREPAREPAREPEHEPAGGDGQKKKKGRRTTSGRIQRGYDLPGELVEVIETLAGQLRCSRSDVIAFLCHRGLSCATLDDLKSALRGTKALQFDWALTPQDFTGALKSFSRSKDTDR